MSRHYSFSTRPTQTNSVRISFIFTFTFTKTNTSAIIVLSIRIIIAACEHFFHALFPIRSLGCHPSPSLPPRRCFSRCPPACCRVWPPPLGSGSQPRCVRSDACEGNHSTQITARGKTFSEIFVSSIKNNMGKHRLNPPICDTYCLTASAHRVPLRAVRPTRAAAIRWAPRPPCRRCGSLIS